MMAIAHALIEAVLFIGFRAYSEEQSLEEYEEEDIQALQTVRSLLVGATEREKQTLEMALEQAIAQLPPDHERLPYYRAWMENMFGEEEELPPPTLEME